MNKIYSFQICVCFWSNAIQEWTRIIATILNMDVRKIITPPLKCSNVSVSHFQILNYSFFNTIL